MGQLQGHPPGVFFGHRPSPATVRKRALQKHKASGSMSATGHPPSGQRYCHRPSALLDRQYHSQIRRRRPRPRMPAGVPVRHFCLHRLRQGCLCKGTKLGDFIALVFKACGMESRYTYESNEAYLEVEGVDIEGVPTTALRVWRLGDGELAEGMCTSQGAHSLGRVPWGHDLNK